jgi:hypothetical protein
MERFEQHVTNTELLADAVGVGEFLLPETDEALRAFDETDGSKETRSRPTAVLPGRIGLLVMELRN